MMASTRDLDLKIKALELNVTDFISIPLDQTELKHRIKNAAKMRKHQKSHLLAQKRIFELQKLEAVSCLTAGVAHEFNNLLLGLLSSFAGVILSVGATYALSKFIFETPFSIDWKPLILTPLIITGLVVLIGLLNMRGIVRKSPLEVLRSVIG